MKGEIMNINLLDNLKQALVEECLITMEQLRHAEQTAELEGETLDKILTKLKFVTEEQLSAFIGNKMHFPYVNLNNYTIDRKVLELIPEKIARRHKFIPLFKIENELTIATSNPLGLISMDDISKLVKCPVDAVIASEESITKAIDQWYCVGSSREELIEELADGFKIIEEELEDESLYYHEVSESLLKKEANEAPIIKLVNNYLAQAVVEGASDIHFQPKKDFMNVKFRIDGFLRDRGHQSNRVSLTITSRLKIMSKMDISQKRIPQDGRISLSLRDKMIDIRASTFPSLYGENVVLRVLDKTKTIPSLADIGLSDEDINIFKKITGIPNGMIIASGPTGSGKSTTIYSFINELDRRDKNIMTIEDPIENEIQEAVQSNVNPKAGVTFYSALKAILRQDPDIIYVGEIRDPDTAKVSVNAALTGHLVLSTLHTNDAVASIVRLHEMGISPELIASVLKCSIAQRLARRICTRCKEQYHPHEFLLNKLGISSNIQFFRGKGCSLCDHSGYKGMIGIFEILVVSSDIKQLITKTAPEHEIREAAKMQGMKTLLEEGLLKVTQGITTVEEIMRLTSGE
jgi:type IV pilus assembly protein PilB